MKKRFFESSIQDATETHIIPESADQEKNKLFSNWRLETVYSIISGLLCLLIVSFVLNLFYIDWGVPFTYESDALGGLRAAQSHINGETKFFPVDIGIVLLQHLKMWFLSLFIDEIGLLVNVFYVLTFFTTGVTTTFALRLLRIKPILSILGGVLYSFLPYHFYRGTLHLFLSTYAIIPLVCVLALWICSGDLEFSKQHRSKIIISFIVIVLLSMTYSALSFLAGIVLAFAVFWNFIEFRSLKKLIAPIVMCVTLIGIVVLFLLPYFLYVADGGLSPMDGSRAMRDVEVFSLKFVEMMLPVQNHRVPLLENFRSAYVSQVSLFPYEGTFSSSLGILMSMGFIISIFIAVRRRKEQLMHNSAVLNVFMLILGAVGGLASLIIFVFQYQRTYNRLSIFIAFYSLFIILFLLDKLLEKINKSYVFFTRLCSYVIIIVIGTLSLLDMVPASNEQIFYLATRNQQLPSWNADRDFVRHVEEITLEGAMVFQLPFVSSTHHVTFNGMGPYDHRRPQLHSKTLIWSYRTAGIGTDTERWQGRVSELPTDQMLRHIAANDFRGVYIDTRGYLGDDAWVLIDEIYAETGITPIISEHAFMYYFHIGEFADYVNGSISDRDRLHYLWEFHFNYPIVPHSVEISTDQLFHGALLSGWSGIEDWGVWSNAHTAELGFSILPDDIVDYADLELSFGLRAFPDPTYLSVYINDFFAAEYELPSGSGHTITMPVSYDLLARTRAVEGIYEINVRFDIANLVSPHALGLSEDTRELGIGLEWFSVSVVDSN